MIGRLIAVAAVCALTLSACGRSDGGAVEAVAGADGAGPGAVAGDTSADDTATEAAAEAGAGADGTATEAVAGAVAEGGAVADEAAGALDWLPAPASVALSQGLAVVAGLAVGAVALIAIWKLMASLLWGPSWRDVAVIAVALSVVFLIGAAPGVFGFVYELGREFEPWVGGAR